MGASVIRHVASALLGALCIVVGLAAGVTSASAERRVALLIGNSAYQSNAQLPNPIRDVEAIRQVLQSAGFDEIIPATDLTLTGMKQALRRFEDAAHGADVAMVYYSGHGIEVNGQNYLVPVDARLLSDRDVEDEAVPLDRVLSALDGARQLKLVLLDACRDNPFVSTMQRRTATRSVTRGLGRVEAGAPNLLIAYAAEPGRVAFDGTGQVSPFSKAISRHLAADGAEIRLALGRIRDDVSMMTDARQIPYFSGSLGGREIYLGRPMAGGGSASDPDATIRADYQMAQAAGTIEAWDAFLRRYPTGFYADLAEQSRRKLSRPIASLTPPGGQSEFTGVVPIATLPLDGTWSGQYTYLNLKQNPVPFAVSLNGMGDRVTGLSSEPNTFGNKSATQLRATWAGRVAADGGIVLTKTYDGSGGVSHSITYRGRLNRAGDVIEGEWQVGTNRGRFTLSRQ
nr:caspase family protein [Prosthecomicrobium hirschii]